ncbi:GNAT family N-acetyltransferase [Microbacterium sp. NPDC090218]
MLTVETLSGEEAAPYRDDVLAIWGAAFGPVEDPDGWRISPWDSHRNRAGYRLAIAQERGRLLGFAWGYTGERGQYWPDLIAREAGSDVEGWIGGHFEFVELAVLPEARRRGIGGRLHEALLSGLPHARALLATSDRADDPAVRLYSSVGWTSLGSYGEGRQVMGLRLDQRTGP